MRRCFTSAVFVLSLVAAGCGDDDGPSSDVVRDEKVVGPNGATLALSDGTKVEIPAGALLEPVTIVIREVDTPKPLPDNLEQAGKTYAFEPHGTLFAEPVKVTLPYDEARDDMLDVRPVKLDDADDDTWQTVVGTDKVEGKLEFDVLSFSFYRAARPNRTSGWITLPDGAAYYPDSGNSMDAAMHDSGDATVPPPDAADAANLADASTLDDAGPDAADADLIVPVFADANLEARVRVILNIPTAQLTQVDLDQLTIIQTGLAQITSLEGLERCGNLVTLQILNASLSDLSPISGLTNLTWLQLGGAGMTGSVADLVSLSNLYTLNLNTSSAVGAIGVLNVLTGLDHLSLNNTDVTGDLTDIAALNSLQTLELASTAVTGNISTLSDVPSLITLSAPDSLIGGDLATLQGRNLALLWLGDFNGDGNPGGAVTGDISSLTSSTQITRLHLTGPSVNVTGNLSDLAGKDEMQNLVLNGAGITGELSSLSSLPSLVTIDLTGASITGDLEDISGMTGLRELRLAGTGIGGSLSAVSGMTALYALVLYGNNVTGDLSALAPLDSLTQLYLSNNSAITGSFTSLVPLPLQWLGVSYTSVTMDLAPIATNPTNQLVSIDAAGNPIDCTAQADELATLRAANITVNVDCP